MEYLYPLFSIINILILIYLLNNRKKIIKFNKELNEIINKQKEIINDLKEGLLYEEK